MKMEAHSGTWEVCSSVGLSYASFSMALGGFFIWTHTYNLIRTSSVKFKALKASPEEEDHQIPNLDWETTEKTNLLKDEHSLKDPQDVENQPESNGLVKKESSWSKVGEFLHQIVEELMAPPTVTAILGFIFVSTPWLKKLLIGDGAPLRVIQDSIKLLEMEQSLVSLSSLEAI